MAILTKDRLARSSSSSGGGLIKDFAASRAFVSIVLCDVCGVNSPVLKRMDLCGSLAVVCDLTGDDLEIILPVARLER